MILDILIFVFIGIGLFFNLLAGIGLLRFPDVYTRLHAGTKCTTFGSIFLIGSVVLIGLRNSVGLSVFYVKSEAISEQGNVLPPALQFGQNNTQTGAGINYGFRLSSLTSVGTSASYSTTTVDTSTGPFANSRSKNANANVSMNTQFGPKTTGSASVGYSWSQTAGSAIGGNISSLNVSATVSHTF